MIGTFALKGISSSVSEFSLAKSFLVGFSPFRVLIVLLLLFLSAGGELSAQQTVVKDIIEPATATLKIEDVFHDKGNGKAEFAAMDSPPFGERAAYIPFWQFSSLYRSIYEEGEQAALAGEGVYEEGEQAALVGNGAVYLPPQLEEAEKTLAALVLEHLRSKKTGENSKNRIEIEFLSPPTQMIRSYEAEAMSLEELSANGGKVRYALYHRGKGPKTVVTVRVKEYVRGYAAVRSFERGELLFRDDVKPTPVEKNEKKSTSRHGDRKNNLLSKQSFDAGYTYRLKRSIETGDIVRPTFLKRIAPVERGDEVECIFHGENLYLTLNGNALGSGGKGDKVRVRLSTGIVKTLLVSGRGKVRAEG